MNARWSWFNITSVIFGFAFLYLPIVISGDLFLQRIPAGHGLGRVLDQMVRRAVSEPGADGRRLGDDPRGAAFGFHRHGAGHDGAVSLVRFTRVSTAARCSPAWSMRRW
jgi:hypothetical protein